MHRRSRRQFLAQAGKFRRGTPAARRVRHVIAEKPHGKYAAAVRARDALGRMQREHVKAHGVARLQFPAENGKAGACGLDVRQVGQRAFGKPLGLVLHEGARHQPRPQMRSGHEFQRGFAIHRINRNPEADVLAAFDIVVRLILVPRRRLPSAGLLRQHVIVVEPNGRAPHQPARGFRQRRIEDETPEVRIVLPIAKVFDEAPRIIGATRHFGARTQVGEILIDTGAKHRHFPRPKQLPDAHGAVALKLFDGCGVNHVDNALIVSSSSTDPRYAKPV